MGEHNPYQSPESMPDASAAPSIANMSGIWRAAFPLAIKIIPALLVFIVIAIVLMAPAVIISQAVPNIIVMIAVMVYQVFVGGFINGCVMKYVYDASKGEGNIGIAINTAKAKVVSLAGGSVVQAIAMIVAMIPVGIVMAVIINSGFQPSGPIGLVLGLVIGFYLLAVVLRLSYTILRIVIDDNKAVESVTGSFDMTRGSLVHLFLVYLPIVAFGVAVGFAFWLAPAAIMEIINALGYAFFAVILVVYIILATYFQSLLVMSYDFIKARRAAM